MTGGTATVGMIVFAGVCTIACSTDLPLDLTKEDCRPSKHCQALPRRA